MLFNSRKINGFWLLFLFILIIPFVNSFSQQWIKSTVIKGTNIEPKYSVVDNDNSIYIYSAFTDTVYTLGNTLSYGVRDMFLKKIDSQGNLLWYKHIGSTKNDNTAGLTIDGSNNIYILGNFFGNCKFTPSDSVINTGNGDVFLAKYNSDGSFQWAKRICSSSTTQGATDLKFDGNNKLVTTGFYTDSLIVGINPANSDTLLGNGFTSNFIAVFDLDGNLQWSKRVLGTYNLSRFIKTDFSQNGYYFGGYFQANLILDIGTITSFTPTAYDAFIYKTDFNGNGQWVRRFRGSGVENFRTLTTDEFDNVYVLGNYNSATIYVDSTETISKTYTGNSGGYDTFIGKYNRSGNLQWFIRKGSSAKDIYNDFVVRNNVIYATGFFTNQIVFNNDILKTSSATNSDAFLAAFNEIGNAIAGVSIVGTGNYEDAGTIVNMDANSRAYVSGYYKSQQIQIGTQTYTSTNTNKSDLFFAIYQHPLKTVFTKKVEVSCNGLSDGMLQATPYFGKPPYNYSWSHDANLHSNTAANLPPGGYTVTITDANNNVAPLTDTIHEPQPLAINPLITPVTCRNLNTGAIDITVTGGTKDYEYFWTTLDGSGVMPLNEDQTGLTDGTYSVTVEDKNHCTKSIDFIVTEPAKFNFAGSTATNLTFPPGNNGAVDLHIAGGNPPYATQWTGPSGFNSALEDLSGLTEGGLYSVALTDSKNCLADTSLVVNDGTTLIAQVTAKTPVLCFGDDNGSAEITVINGVAPYSYQWSDGLNTPLNTRTNMASGTYQVLVSDAFQPVAHTAQVEVVIDGPRAALSALLDPDNLRCYQDTSGVVNLTASGGTLPYRFSWNTGYKGEDLVEVPSGSYAVTVTDTNNCIAQANTSVTEPAAVGLDVTIDTRILCHGENTASATANVTGGSGDYSYLWNDPGTQVTKTAVQLFAGNYKVTVTDQNKCTLSEFVLITEPDSLAITTIINPPSCTGSSDASLVPTVTGGSPLYDYVWSNNEFHHNNIDIPAGTYSLTITDINNCSISDTFVINDPPPVIISRIDSTNATCFGAADGSIHIDASGGTGPLSYSADNGLSFSSLPDIGSLAAGLHTVVVKDSNDCPSAARTVTVVQPEEITIDTVLVTNASCYGNPDGSVTVTALGGTGVFEYSADNGATFIPSATIVSLMSGAHQVVVKDSSDCLSTAYPVTVGPAEIIIDTAVVTDASCYGYTDGAIEITALGGTGVFEYSADNGASFIPSPIIVSLENGTYQVVVKDSSDCLSAAYPVTVGPDVAFTVDTIEVVRGTIDSPLGSISLENTGGISPVNFVIIPDSSSNTTGVFNDLVSQDYRLFAMDANLCKSNELLVSLPEPETKLFVYDAFSPNGDGKNDVWHIPGIGKYPDCSVKIFNTWGVAVFTSKGYGTPWDGKYNGNDLPSGTYYYVIDPGDGSGVLTGPVSIVK
jgi:gliding motility-associated-like protein